LRDPRRWKSLPKNPSLSTRILKALNDFAAEEEKVLAKTEALSALRQYPIRYDPLVLDMIEVACKTGKFG
jgi:hypothetical protein